MKYKAKFSALEYGHQKPITEDSTFDSNEYGGMMVFIPFTDQRFFEPIKTRMFKIEVEEDQMTNFQIYCERPGYWTVTEITETGWIDQYYKSGSYNAHLFSTDELYTIDVEEFKDEYQYGNKLQGVKWIKDRFGKGLKESKELADFIFALSV